ncbi:LacI family DNA-binding transcriptional regulator [Fundicoccus culcitae]|uniref:LacI family transcriptional regulator n=1 Tax=Fundicoccus culcitae TaxID=2969821 RepID=A0ABY5P552_9LACT|nr:LacI family DNA-binding transcriptional regulator [Fundicoccus culcitae]UUX33872.1 LacI family transcriptional regulator [Fundicoccus culcitae]
MKKTSIHDVAKLAGVSIATVSKALNNSPVVTPETKKRVIEAANQLNYVPNRASKQLKSGQTNTISFFTTSIAAPYFANLADVMAREVSKRGYSFNIFLSTDRQTLINNILGHSMDGLIGFVDLIDNEIIQLLKDYRIKTVFIDRAIEAETIGSVIFDSYQKGKEMTEYLIQLGHRKIGFVKSFDGIYDSDERMRGYTDALVEAGIAVDQSLILQGNFAQNISYIEMKNFIKRNREALPTAIFAGNDLSAVGVIQAVEESGLRVPDDMSVVGFDDLDYLQYFKPRLTTIYNPINLQGELVVDHLIKLIEGKTEGQTIELPGRLIVRESSKSITIKQ